MKRKVQHAVLSVALLTSMMAGCDRQPQTPPTSNVPIRVVGVLAPAENLGNSSNLGSRLLASQIGQYIAQLNKYAAKNMGDGVTIEFTNPDGSRWTTSDIVMLVDMCLREFPDIGGGVCFFDPREYPLGDFQTRVVAQDSGYNGSGINIYFVGNVFPAGGNPASAPAGITFDEEVVCSDQDPRPFIMINDRGGTGANTAAMFVPKRLPLEHEMCHYLIRGAFNTSGYTAAEHTVSSTANNIMRSGLTLPPSQVRPRFLPKAARMELTQRVQTNINPCP